jgi:DNA primase (EC 2.7.7.-)
MIHARIEVDGIVDKSDIVGALFGQTEGLLGAELDLRELQNNGRIGRIEVNVSRSDGKVKGIIKVPSNLGRIETALVAAALETVDRVGPYTAKVEVVRIEDVRAEKRKRIVERARELLQKMEEVTPETKELVEEVAEALKTAELVYYGPEKLPAGPEVEQADTVIIVEGRADVVNLLKHGYKNVIALEGATIPKSLIDLANRKKTVLFVDGDRGGELIARNVIGAMKIDYVARAPPGREVEELTGKEIAKALKNKVETKEFLEQLRASERAPEETGGPIEKVEVQPAPPLALQVPQQVVDEIKGLRGTLEAVLYDSNWKPVKRVAVRDLINALEGSEGISYIVFDGVITQRLVDIASSKNVTAVIGARMGDIVRLPDNLVIKIFDDFI